MPMKLINDYSIYRHTSYVSKDVDNLGLTVNKTASNALHVSA
jgi:hypothetical protein